MGHQEEEEEEQREVVKHEPKGRIVDTTQNLELRLGTLDSGKQRQLLFDKAAADKHEWQKTRPWSRGQLNRHITGRSEFKTC